ncbi:hypothetical protein BGX20_007805 [Mortierella sp. AD010]|nr:hypothetical protein BGX20_007805 [Mortierella sp. AD010]
MDVKSYLDTERVFGVKQELNEEHSGRRSRHPRRIVPTFNGVNPLADNYVYGFGTVAVTNPPVHPQPDPSTNSIADHGGDTDVRGAFTDNHGNSTDDNDSLSHGTK